MPYPEDENRTLRAENDRLQKLVNLLEAEIDRLRAENDRLQRYATNMIGAMNIANEMLRAEVARMRFELKAAQEEIKIADEQIERMKAALADQRMKAALANQGKG